MISRGKVIFILGAFLFGTTLLTANTASASDNAVELAISPVSHKVELAQGETYEGKFYVANVGTEEFDYEVAVKPFGVSDVNYNVNYEENEYTSIVGWTTLSRTTGHIEPNNKDEIVFTITVPEKAVAGGQYLAIVASTTDEVEENASGFNVTGGAASLVYASITGDAKNSGEITENSIPAFYFNGPAKFNSTVSNTGDVHNAATYTIEVRNFFSGEVIYENSNDPLTHIILPNTQRFESTSWETPMLGIFRAKQTIVYAGQTSVEEGIIVVCPAWFIFASIFVIVSLVVRIVLLFKKRRENRL